MPIVIPKDIPAFDVLTRENIFVMGSSRAATQDIRPLEIAIVNLMPTKVETETQLMRILSNSMLQINVTLVRTATYSATNVAQDYLERFYVTFDQIKDKKFDGMIVTGAPVETLDFEEVKYWDELCRIMEYAERNVTSSVFICWGAQAALNYYYGIGKRRLDKKKFGIFGNRSNFPFEPLLRGLNDEFFIPHSRHTEIDEETLK
ncbi:MAG: homoserine O-succinyltransferase, partial [Clostridia bacterium]|nr:homoserine O-succinyltransferase [Clostridia bacterium]